MPRTKTLTLHSWNVNGIRAALKKGFVEYLDTYRPDIVCLQETKAHPDQVDVDFTDYHEFWNDAEKKGYAGTAVFTRSEPLAVTRGMGLAQHDTEGRIITCEYPDFILVNVYTPNAQRGLTRLKYRQQWDADFLKYVTRLERKKPVVFCGDLNVAHTEIDLANPKQNVKNAGFTPEERAGFENLVTHGFVDTFRHQHPDEPGHYSWWTYRANARARNIGWRIDYVCVSKTFLPRVKEAFILPDVYGSDHCPVGVTLKLS